MDYYVLYIPAEKSATNSVIYRVSAEDPCTTYEQFCALKSLCAFPPDLWEIVRVSVCGRQFAMLVDEEGLFHDVPLNSYASYLYGGYIVGDVVLLRPANADLYFLTAEDIEAFKLDFETLSLPQTLPSWRTVDLKI